MKNALTIAAIVAAIIALPVGCSYVYMAQTAATAPARVINKTLQIDNIIFNYERFFDLNKNYRNRLPQIAESKQAYAEEKDPDEKSRLRVEMNAQKASCRDLANSYNADAVKLNSAMFRDRGLPASLDVSACE